MAALSTASSASSIGPVPWPAPRMSRHALLPAPKSIFVLSLSGSASGSSPASTMLPDRVMVPS